MAFFAVVWQNKIMSGSQKVTNFYVCFAGGPSQFLCMWREKKIKINKNKKGPSELIMRGLSAR